MLNERYSSILTCFLVQFTVLKQTLPSLPSGSHNKIDKRYRILGGDTGVINALEKKQEGEARQICLLCQSWVLAPEC